MSPFHDPFVAPVLVTSPPIVSTPCGIVAGTCVLTANRGVTQVEDLDPELDRLVGFDPRAEGRDEWSREISVFPLAARRAGLRFEVQPFSFVGDVQRIIVHAQQRHRLVRLAIDATPAMRLLDEPKDDGSAPRARPFSSLDSGITAVGISPNHDVAYWEVLTSVETIPFRGNVFEIRVQRHGTFIGGDFIVYGGRLDDAE
ncbi:MAG: hypothetical protein HY292_18860 [Planctomycetes bacterium]|nr:hypothetical protein [Planctomycetota bacterium]